MKSKRGKACAISPQSSPPKRIYTLDFRAASKPFRHAHALRTCLLSRVRNHFLPLLTESLDAESDHVTRLQPRLGRFHTECHPSRRSGSNNVTREQRHVVAHVRDELRTGENHVPGIGGLPAFAVDVEPEIGRAHV